MIQVKKLNEGVWELSPNKKTDGKIQPYLIASRNPVDEVNRVIEKIDFNYHTNFVVFGMKNFMLLKEIFFRMSEHSTLTIFEICNDDQLLWEADVNIARILFSNDRVKINIGNSQFLLSKLEDVFFDMRMIYNMKNMHIITMPYMKSMHAEELKTLVDSLFERLYSLATLFGNDVGDILVGIDNFISSWDKYTQGVHATFFKNQLKDLPVIIVGAGPSLEKNIEYLKEAQKYAYIFAVDAVLDKLLAEGITPDVVSTIERTDLPLKFYKKVENESDITFVGPNVLSKELLEKFNNIIFTGREGDVFFRRITEHFGFNNLDIGSNVAHVPFAFAEHLGCNPIIFAGLDLAYTDGRTHIAEVENNLSDEGKAAYQSGIMYVSGQEGERLETRSYFLFAKVWFENKILQNPSTHYVNSTEGGAEIIGMTNQSLKKSIEDISLSGEKLESFKALYLQSKENHKGDTTNLTEEALDFLKGLKRNIKLLKKVIKQSKLSVKKANSSNVERRILLNIDEIAEVLTASEVIKFIFQPVTIAYYRNIQSLPIKKNDKDRANLLAITKKFYSDMASISDKVFDAMESHQKRLEGYLTTGEM